LTVAALLYSPLASAAPAAEYVVDSEHTSIVFGVGHAKMSLVYGFFKKAQGAYLIDWNNPANCRFRFVVDVNSIDTNHRVRDDHLKGPDFFDAAAYPQMRFESTSCTLTTTREGAYVYNVTGDMTIRGVKQRVTLPLRLLAEGEQVVGQRKDRRTGFLCQFELKRSDFGMTEVPLVGDAVGITISFEGILQEPATQTAPATVRRP
jgi:polyisoprenoid-binding protein YceI